MKTSEPAHFGQKIISATSPDRSSGKVNEKEAFHGRKMKGGPDDTSAQTNQFKYNDMGKAPGR